MRSPGWVLMGRVLAAVPAQSEPRTMVYESGFHHWFLWIVAAPALPLRVDPMGVAPQQVGYAAVQWFSSWEFCRLNAEWLERNLMKRTACLPYD